MVLTATMTTDNGKELHLQKLQLHQLKKKKKTHPARKVEINQKSYYGHFQIDSQHNYWSEKYGLETVGWASLSQSIYERSVKRSEMNGKTVFWIWFLLLRLCWSSYPPGEGQPAKTCCVLQHEVSSRLQVCWLWHGMNTPSLSVCQPVGPSAFDLLTNGPSFSCNPFHYANISGLRSKG